MARHKQKKDEINISSLLSVHILFSGKTHGKLL